jgi:hypothetical protein
MAHSKDRVESDGQSSPFSDLGMMAGCGKAFKKLSSSLIEITYFLGSETVKFAFCGLYRRSRAL